MPDEADHWIKQVIQAKPELFSGSVTTAILGRGENNTNYKVTVGNEEFVFRITYREELEENLANEYRKIQKLPEGVGARPVLLDTSHDFVDHNFAVYTFIPGTTTHEWTPKQREMHARTLAMLHKAKYGYYETDSLSSQKEAVFSLLERFDSEMQDYQAIFDASEEFRALLSDVRKYFVEVDSAFTTLSSFSFIHGDLNISNIILSPDSIHYIDWEWSRIGDPARDLALFYNTVAVLPRWYVHLTEAEEKEFLKEYLKSYGSDETLLQRVHAWQVYDVFCNMMYFQRKLTNQDFETLSESECQEDIQESKRALPIMLKNYRNS